MMTRYIRWQAAIALGGILLMSGLLNHFAGNLDTVVVPQPGGLYVEALASRPAILNPLYPEEHTRADQDLMGLFFNGLTRVDAAAAPQPDLARSWDISEDGRSYTFRLRKDVLWHDGAPFTAEDVAFTVAVMQDPDFTGEPTALDLWRMVAVEVVDRHTIRFTLPEESAPFAPFLSFTTFGILPKHLLESTPVAQLSTVPFNQNPVGTGPWRIVRSDANQLLLEPHPAYFGKKPMLDRLIFRVYEDADAALQAYQEGEVMGVSYVKPGDIREVLADRSLELHSTPISGYTALFFNLRRPILQSLPVREALALGLDRQEIIEATRRGQGILANSFLMPTHWAYNPEVPTYPYNLDEARTVLEEDGWVDTDDDGVREKDGVDLSLSVLVGDGTPELKVAAAVVTRHWSRLGIQVEPSYVSADDLVSSLRSHEFDAVLLATPIGGVPSDPDFYPLWHSSQVEDGLNYTGFQSEEADRLLVEARHALDTDTRRALYNEFQVLLAEGLPALPLYYPIYNYAVSTNVNDVQLAPMNSTSDRFLSLPSWYVKLKRLLIEEGDVVPTIAPPN